MERLIKSRGPFSYSARVTYCLWQCGDRSSLPVWGGGYPQSLAAHSPCLQGIIKAQPVPTHGCICESLHTVINPRPATSISTHNIIRKQAEQRITEPAPGLGIMARPIRAGRGENDVLF